MRRHHAISVIAKSVAILVLFAILAAGCGGGSVTAKVQSLKGSKIEETITTNGALSAWGSSQVIPQVYGFVKDVYVVEGQQVTEGQPLVQLETDALEQAVLSAQAGLESARSIAGTLNGFSAAFSRIGSTINSAIGNIDLAVGTLFSLSEGFLDYLPPTQRAELEALLRDAQAQYKNASFDKVDTGVGGYATGMQTASANKAIQLAKKNLDAATITAPTSGTVIAASAGSFSLNSIMATMMQSFSGMMPAGMDLSSLTSLSTSSLNNLGFAGGGDIVTGAVIMPGSPIFEIVDLNSMLMATTVEESEISKVAIGQPATLSLEAYPDREFRGSVSFISDVATTNQAGTTAFQVGITLERSEIALKIGMTGIADITISSKENASSVPIDALVEQDNKNYVYVVKDGKARLTEVKIGIVSESSAEILSGVSKGEKVAVSNVSKLKDGVSVSQK